MPSPFSYTEEIIAWLEANGYSAGDIMADEDGDYVYSDCDEFGKQSKIYLKDVTF